MKTAYEKALENIEKDEIPVSDEAELDPIRIEEIANLLDEWMSKCGYDAKERRLIHHTDEQIHWFADKICEMLESNLRIKEIESDICLWSMMHYGNTGYSKGNRYALAKKLSRYFIGGKKNG